ncbi:MAG TPA: hypothetical protein VLT86_05880 [Vicinamibacterales bacterium]|nr:hypothetical protein [Vicinamibacterales bacterium]
MRRWFNRWLGGEESMSTTGTLRTRASDHVPNLNIAVPRDEPQKPAARVHEPAELSPPRP